MFGLLFIRFVVAGVAEEVEALSSLVLLARALLLLCFLFFLSTPILLFYFLFELALFPIIISILFYGGQVEKVGAFYYLLVYGTFFSLPLLYLLLVNK